MKKMETRALVEAALLVSLAAIILIISIMVPFFAPIGVIIWPIPITLLTFKHNLKISVVSLFALIAVVIGFAGPINTVLWGLLYGIPAIVLGFCLRKKYSSFSTVIATSLSMFLMYIAFIKLSVLLTGVDVLNLNMQVFEESWKRSGEIMKSLGANDEQINQVVSQGIDVEALRLLIPGALAVASLMSSFIVYYFVGVIFRRLQITINELKPISYWYINNNLSFGLFFLTVAAWFMTYLKVRNSDIVFSSVFVIFSFAFIVNGLSALSWFLKNRGLSNKIRMPILAFAFIGGFSQILFYLGLIDYVIDFRKINPSRRRRNPPGE